jgi:endonuclease/exonuclease/phosphatase family metal-dependent hydrolase
VTRSMKRWMKSWPTPFLFAALSGCAAGLNYPSASGPRFSEAGAAPGDTGSSLRLVTFNLEYGERVDSAIALFRQTSELRDADVVVMQEMHEGAVARIAGALGMGYVYYPAVVHPKFGRNFGNAILSRWPVEEDRKLVLPFLSRTRKTQRIAVSGTIRVAGVPVRVYTVHLATIFDNGAAAQREQVRAIVADAARYERVIVAGDMNGSGSIAREFERAGYAWTTRAIGRTMKLWTVDHVFLRGLALTSPQHVGVVRDNHRASDHRPVWAVVGAR